jgi:hypothetical protein
MKLSNEVYRAFRVAEKPDQGVEPTPASWRG